MNIRQALYQNLSESTMVDSYYAKIMVKGEQKTYIPVDFRLRKGKISIPLKPDDIYFEYRTRTEKSNVCRGEYVLTKYYPIGTILNIEDMKLKIVSYGEPTSVAGRTRVPVYTVCLNQDESNLIEVITNKSVEDKVKRELESILISNDIIKRKLPYYKYDWMNYTEENISAYEECQSLKKLFEIKFMESCEYEYRLNDNEKIMDMSTYGDFADEHWKFLDRMNYEKMVIKYNRAAIKFNLMSIAKWILYYRQFNKGNLYLQGKFGDLCRLEIYRGNNKSVIINIYTPDCSYYNYRIELVNVVKCNMNRAYYDYIMDNIRVFTITKDCCATVTELINLTGAGSESISTNIIRIRPAKAYCAYSPWGCINNCPPANCNSTKPGGCINQCPTGDDTDSGNDDNITDCPGQDEAVTIPEDQFNDTFFRIFCELLRYICASPCAVKESGAVCKDEYYSLLNNLLIDVINKFKEEIGDDEIYSNTAEEFLQKYSELLGKTPESITFDDSEELTNALDDYDHLPEEEKAKLEEEKDKLDELWLALQQLELGSSVRAFKRTFITVDTIEVRDSIPVEQLVDGRIVRVNDTGLGEPGYYSYDMDTNTWVEEDFLTNDKRNEIDNVNSHIYWNELTMEGV